MEVVGRPAESNQMCLAYEARAFDRRGAGAGHRLSCTLVTGFLGSGKTTLVRHILQNRGDLRVAVLVNDYAEADIDGILLDTASLNRAFGLSSVSLVNGCACCKVSGEFKEAVDKVLRSKHNFDYLVIETSGLADPVKIAKDLQDMGVQLDVIVTVVDVEALDKIVGLPIALQQLSIADIVLINKCDLASLGIISDAEDAIQEKTGGFKAIRCRFCRVPLELVLDIQSVDAAPISRPNNVQAFDGVLSHETTSGSPYFPSAERKTTKEMNERSFEKNNSLINTDKKDHHISAVSSVTFETSAPLCMAGIQDIIINKMFQMKGLLRAKGVLWLNENRQTRQIFHWSGKKRVEVTFGGIWESPPSTSLVFIGMDKNELDLLKSSLENAQIDNRVGKEKFCSSSQNNEVKQLEEKLASDSRFKVNERTYHVSCFNTHSCIVFGMVGSPLHGIHEADLNAALMRFVNARGVLFLTAITSSREDHLLQFCLTSGNNQNLEVIWNELQTAATAVRAKLMKDKHPCRCDFKHHHHEASE